MLMRPEKIYEFKGTDYFVQHTNFLLVSEECLCVLEGIFNGYKLHMVHIATQNTYIISIWAVCFLRDWEDFQPDSEMQRIDLEAIKSHIGPRGVVELHVTITERKKTLLPI